MNALILEDNIIQLNALSEIVSTYQNITVLKANSYDAAFELYKQNKIDLFLLDIELDIYNPKEKTGIDFAKHIRNNPNYLYTPIIFVTSIPDKVTEALNHIHCFHYLVKPYTTENVLNILSELFNSAYMTPAPLLVRDPNGIYNKLTLSDILFIYSSHKKLRFVTTMSECISYEYTLSQIKNELNTDFVQCHKQYIINPTFIATYDRTNQLIKLQGSDEIIPVGRKYKQWMEERILK